MKREICIQKKNNPKTIEKAESWNAKTFSNPEMQELPAGNAKPPGFCA